MGYDVSQMREVQSSAIQRIDFSDDLGLVVLFQSGGLYNYPNEPRETYEDMCDEADRKERGEGGSVGKYFHRNVDKGAGIKLE